MSQEVILHDRPVLVPSLIIWSLAAMIMGAPIALVFSTLRGQVYQMLGGGLLLFIVALCAIRLLVDVIDAKTTEYTLTGNELIKEWGILHRDQKVVPLANVQVVTVRQPLLGRLMRYGSVVVQAGGFGGTRIGMVSDPHAWKRAILQAAPATRAVNTEVRGDRQSRAR